MGSGMTAAQVEWSGEHLCLLDQILRRHWRMRLRHRRMTCCGFPLDADTQLLLAANGNGMTGALIWTAMDFHCRSQNL